MKQLEGGWPERVLTMQRNWIGRSEGAEVDFTLAETGEADSRLHHARRHHLRRDLRDSSRPSIRWSKQLLDAEGKAHAKSDDRRARATKVPAMSKRKASSPAIYAHQSVQRRDDARSGSPTSC